MIRATAGVSARTRPMSMDDGTAHASAFESGAAERSFTAPPDGSPPLRGGSASGESCGTRHRLEGGVDDVLVDADAPASLAILGLHLDIGRREGVGPGTHRMLAVIEHLEVGNDGAAKRIDEGFDRSGAVALDRPTVRQRCLQPTAAPFGHSAVDGDRLGEIGLIEEAPDLGAGRLLAGAVGPVLHDLRELDLGAARQVQPMIRLEEVGDAALARLAVDADHRLVAAPEILRIDRQVGYFPELVVALLERLEAFLDRVLVRAGERR